MDDRQGQQQGQGFEQGIQTGLGIAWLLSGPAAVLARRVGSSGHRFWGIASLLGCLAPLVLAQGQVSGAPFPTDMERRNQLVCMVTACALVTLWALHRAASRKNRGLIHSRETGVTWGCTRLRPLVELVIVLAVAYGVGFASDAVAGLLGFSGLANAICGQAIYKRQELEVENAADAMLRGRAFSHDLERFRR